MREEEPEICWTAMNHRSFWSVNAGCTSVLNWRHWLEADRFPRRIRRLRCRTPSFLVATSAGEVGVDLDADHIVCDLVAHERMVQRLGRVNRRGGEGRTAKVEVFAVRPEAKANARKGRKAGRTRERPQRRTTCE